MEYGELSKQASNFDLGNVLSDHCMYNVTFVGKNSKYINFYPEESINHSVPSVLNWRIQTFEQRLRETERSYNVVDIVKTLGLGFATPTPSG